MLKNFFPFTQSSSPQLIITIEFLTHSEKSKKTFALSTQNSEKKRLESENNDYEIEMNPFSLYFASLRVNLEIYESFFNLNEVFRLAGENDGVTEKSGFSQIAEFFKLNVKEYVILVGDKEIFQNQKNIMDLQNHNVVEVVYILKPNWERVWLSTQKFIRSWLERMWGLMKKGGFLFMMTGMFKSSWAFKILIGYFFPWLLLF